MSNIGYAVATPRIRSSTKRRTAVNKVTTMKMTFKQRLRNWLFEEKESADDYSQDITIEEDRFGSNGMRLNVYKGNGGFVVEARNYDRKHDENRYSMYIVHEEKDLGNELGKIITMECMK
jgi:hypothetical protein